MSMSGQVRAGSAFIEITADDSKAIASLRSMSARMKTAANSFSSAGGAMMKLALPTAIGAGFSVKWFADLDTSMRMVQSVSGATNEEFKDLYDTVRKLGRETIFSPQEISSGMVNMSRLGLRPEEIRNVTKPMMDLSLATGTDLPEAVNIAANTMRAFGKSSSDITDIVDTLTVTANGSAQVLLDLGEAMKMVAPSGKTVKDSVKDVSAMLGVLANVGIRGSLAGNALKRIYQQMADPEIVGILKIYGVETKKANGDLRSMLDIFRDLSKAMKEMPTAEKLSFANKIFELRGAVAGLSLTDNINELDSFRKRLDDVSGAAASVSENIGNGLGGQISKTMNSVRMLGITLGTALEPSVRSLGESIRSAALEMQNFINQNPQVASALAQITTGVIVLSGTLIALSSVMKIFAFAIGPVIALKTAISAFNLTLIGTQWGIWTINAGITSKALLGLIPILGTVGSMIAVAFGGYYLGKFIGDIGIVKKWLEKAGDASIGRDARIQAGQTDAAALARYNAMRSRQLARNNANPLQFDKNGNLVEVDQTSIGKKPTAAVSPASPSDRRDYISLEDITKAEEEIKKLDSSLKSIMSSTTEGRIREIEEEMNAYREYSNLLLDVEARKGKSGLAISAKLSNAMAVYTDQIRRLRDEQREAIASAYEKITRVQTQYEHGQTKETMEFGFIGKSPSYIISKLTPIVNAAMKEVRRTQKELETTLSGGIDIGEFEKKYTDALKKVEEQQKKVIQLQFDMKNIGPGLKESQQEKMRKALNADYAVLERYKSEFAYAKQELDAAKIAAKNAPDMQDPRRKMEIDKLQASYENAASNLSMTQSRLWDARRAMMQIRNQQNVGSYNISAVIGALGRRNQNEKLEKIAEAHVKEAEKTNRTLTTGVPVKMAYVK